MTIIDTLKAIQKFLEDEVASDMEFQKEGNPEEYVNPYVGVMSLPHKNFMPVDFQVPYIIVGLANGIDDTDEAKLTIRITCATYGGEIVEGIPDTTGYIDLLNLIDRIKLKLIETAVINGAGTVHKPINYGVYNEQLTYPYWYGYLEFDIQIPETEFPMMDF